MYCPHCNNSISLFSKTINTFEKNRVCPNCEQPIKSYFSFKSAMIWFVPIFIFNFIVSAILGFDAGITMAATVGIIMLVSTKLKIPQEDNNV